MTDHDKRMHSCLYSNDGRVELCERICKLEKLAAQMAVVIAVRDAEFLVYDDEALPATPIFADELAELGIDVPSLGFEV